MFAVVRTGGKQYRVAAGDKIAVEKLAGEAGDKITLGDILLAGEDGELRPALGGQRQLRAVVEPVHGGRGLHQRQARAWRPAASAIATAPTAAASHGQLRRSSTGGRTSSAAASTSLASMLVASRA